MEQELLRVIDGICTIKGYDDSTNESEGTTYDNDEDNERLEDEDDGELVVPKETCIESLRDLQRLIRRDDPQKGTVKLLLGTMYSHGFVHKIMVPLITRKDADPILISACLSEKINQYELQMTILRKHKMALLTRPFMNFLFTQLEQPLRRLRSGGEGNDIEMQDVQTVELILALIRNVLLIPDAPRGFGSTLQDTLIGLFYDEVILDAILIIIGISEDHNQWSLVLLDIIYFLFKGENPESIWNECSDPISTINTVSSSLSQMSSSLVSSSSLSTSSLPPSSSAASQLLAQKLRAEGGAMLRKKSMLLNRPPRFYKPFVVSELDGSFLVSGTSITDGGPVSCASPSRPSKSGIVLNKHRMTKVTDVPTSEDTHSAPRTRAILKEYAGKFLDSGYPILLRTVTDFIKNTPEEVLPSDSLNRLWLIYFFTSFHFHRESEKCKSDPNHVVDVAPVSGSMDVESITSIVQFIEKFDMSESAPSKTAVATAILAICELLRILLLMVSQKKGTEMHKTGVTLALNLFHDTSLLLNRIPIMIAKYSPRTRTIKELEALIETADVLIDVVKTIIQSGTEIFVQSKRELVYMDKAKRDEKILFKGVHDGEKNEDNNENDNQNKEDEKGNENEKADESGNESEYEDVCANVPKNNDVPKNDNKEEEAKENGNKEKEGDIMMEDDNKEGKEDDIEIGNENKENKEDGGATIIEDENKEEGDIIMEDENKKESDDKSGNENQMETEIDDIFDTEKEENDNRVVENDNDAENSDKDDINKNDTNEQEDATQVDEPKQHENELNIASDHETDDTQKNKETEDNDEHDTKDKEGNKNEDEEENDDDDDDNNGADEEHESNLRYSTYISLFCNNAIIENYVLMLSRLDALNNRTLYAVTNILSRLISDVPGAKGFFWQLPLFHSFEKIFSFCKTAILGPVSQEKKNSVIKIRDLITQVLTDFFMAAEKDESLYIKIFCWRTKVKNRSISGTRDRIAGDNTEDAMNVEEEEREEEERQKKRKLRMKKRKEANDDDNKKEENKEEDFYQNVLNQKENEKEDNGDKESKEEEKGNDKRLVSENDTLDDIFKEMGNDDDDHSDTEKNEDEEKEKEKEKNSGKMNKLRKLVRGREYDEDEYGDDDDLFGPNNENDDDNDGDYSDEKIRSEPAKKKKKKKHHHHHHE